MSATDVSIIIRTLNEERYLEELLSSISLQECEYTTETILIDSGSTDNTIQIAQAFDCRILHISRDDFSFGRSLNLACQASASRFLIFISGHCVPKDNQWIQALVTPLSEGNFGYVYGRQLGGPSTYWSEAQIFDKYFPATSQLPQCGFYCNNANSAISREVWNKYRFDEELTGLEDMHLAKRLFDDGGLIGYVANASVFHLHHESWHQIERRFEREAIALQNICPEIVVRKRDFIRYFLRAIIKDITTSELRVLNLKHMIQIFAYRYFQYKGSFKGNQSQKIISKQLRESYFYPTRSKGKPLTSGQ